MVADTSEILAGFFLINSSHSITAVPPIGSTISWNDGNIQAKTYIAIIETRLIRFAGITSTFSHILLYSLRAKMAWIRNPVMKTYSPAKTHHVATAPSTKAVMTRVCSVPPLGLLASVEAGVGDISAIPVAVVWWSADVVNGLALGENLE